ncbi:MAG: hypothetical protein ACYTGQ_14725 [Planctomycetota bacterium]
MPVCSADAVQLLGVGLEGASQMRAGREAEATAEANADIANMQAEAALRRGRVRAQQLRADVARPLSRQRVAASASGLDPGAGTALDLAGETARIGELDAQTIKTNAFLEAEGYRFAAKQQKRAARAAKHAGFLQGAGTLLGGAGTIFLSEPSEPEPLFGLNGKKKKKSKLGSPYSTQFMIPMPE